MAKHKNESIAQYFNDEFTKFKDEFLKTINDRLSSISTDIENVNLKLENHNILINDHEKRLQELEIEKRKLKNMEDMVTEMYESYKYAGDENLKFQKAFKKFMVYIYIVGGVGIFTLGGIIVSLLVK